jgi:hypothetical protein
VSHSVPEFNQFKELIVLLLNCSETEPVSFKGTAGLCPGLLRPGEPAMVYHLLGSSLFQTTGFWISRRNNRDIAPVLPDI